MKTVGALLYLVGPLLLAQIHPITAFDCFDDDDPKWYLRAAVQAYATNNSADTEVAKKFGHPIGNWCVDNVTEFNSAFLGVSNFNEALTYWNTTKAKSMAHMFHGASNFNQKLNHFVTNSVKDFRYMFYNAKNFNRDISNWNLQSAWYLNNMFGSADAFAADFSRDLCNWGYYADTFLNVNNMFANTDCPDTDNPNLTAVTPGPFCYRCPTTCVPVAACVPQIWTACSITPPCNLTSTCFTTAVQGCCTNGKPSTLYAQQVRDAYAGEHCKDVVCQTPAKCAASIWDNCEPLCNTAYKCFQNGVKRCCTDALPNATYIARVTGTYSKTFCKCNPMPTDPVKVCALEVKSQCHVGQPGCQMNSTCFHNVTSACCRNETSLADFATHVKQETQNLCRGCTPPLHPIAACVRQVRRTCRTCRLRLRDDCVRGVVMKCCLPGPPRLWMDTIRDRYRRKYCTTPSPVRT